MSSHAPFGCWDRLLDVNRAFVSDDLSQSGFDHSGSDELCAHSVRGAAGYANDHCILAHGYELDAARVVLEERTEDIVDQLLNRLTHGRSMENCVPKRKQS